ncbi:MAG: undecaprenyldiphospho-muramoylpentapeptide beta-N-acetylglucosaminyltransferase [Candidatus Firestonebacteria bacterium]|nr:undecaprenyldiphospho-muramoylpentapeptide beta-N-acetylglucosaminyltransferase [Candidatus Firestonebacteria bacterium]
MRAMIVCGGTGGHIYPGIALARALKNREDSNQIIFVGRKDSLEERIFLKEGWEYKTICSSGMPRNFSFTWIPFIIKTLIGIFQSNFIVLGFKPDIIIGTGAYLSFPILFTGKLFGIPELILEPNVYPGLTTRILAGFADRIAIAFEDTKNYLTKCKDKCLLTGNPVRSLIALRKREEAEIAFNLYERKKTVLIFGGSQGASCINQSCIDMKDYIEPLKDKVQFIFITGDDDFKKVSENYEKSNVKVIVAPFIYNMEDAFALADMVVCRAGATTLAEITTRGIPAVLIPYPYATDNHQMKNAQYLEQNGAAKIILDRELTGYKLAEAIKELLLNDRKLNEMHEASKKIGRPDALENIIKIVNELAD